MGTEEDFWGDDAAALQQREVERATGLRMPQASDTRISSTGVNADSAGSLSVRQIAFALCLGVELKPSDSVETISKRIDHTKARADSYSVNEQQLAIAGLVQVDIEDCDTRGQASWLLWEEFEDNSTEFFRNLSADFQRQFCGGQLSRFIDLRMASATPYMPAASVGVQPELSRSCRVEVSEWCVMCSSCGHYAGNVHPAAWVVSLTIAVFACALIHLMIWGL